MSSNINHLKIKTTAYAIFTIIFPNFMFMCLFSPGEPVAPSAGVDPPKHLVLLVRGLALHHVSQGEGHLREAAGYGSLPRTDGWQTRGGIVADNVRIVAESIRIMTK